MKQVLGILFCFAFAINNLLQAQCSSVTVEAYQVSVGNWKVRATLTYPHYQDVGVNGSITEPGGPTDIYTVTISAGNLSGQTDGTWQMSSSPDLTISNVIPCPLQLSEQQSEQILLSSVFQNLIQLRNDFLDKIDSVISNGTSLSTIREAALDAIQNNNYQQFYTMLFSSYENGVSFVNSLESSRNAFLQANPHIEESLEDFACQTCNTSLTDQANYFFDNFENFNTYRYTPAMEEDTDPGQDPGSNLAKKPTCGSFWNQIKLGICAAACGATTLGLATPLCGWGCWCTFCTKNSALANVICAN